MKVAWDIDHTLILSKMEPRPAIITTFDEPYLNPVVVGREDKITNLITGRNFKLVAETVYLILHLGCKVDLEIRFNPLENYDQKYIAKMKSRHLELIGATHYVEDNSNYRDVMRRFWNGEVISSEEWGDL